MRKTIFVAALLVTTFAQPAAATIKTVPAYCESVEKKVVTNIFTVTVDVDMRSNNAMFIASKMGEKIGYQAAEALHAMGIDVYGSIYCRFADPTMVSWSNENKTLDYLRTLPGKSARRGYRLVTIELSEKSPKVPAARSSTSSARKPVPAPPSGPPVKKPTPNQIKYQQELAAYQARLTAIEEQKIARARQLDASRKRASAAQQAYEGERAKSDAAQRDYRERAAEHQRIVDSLRARQDKNLSNLEPVEWREAVSVCSLDSDNPQSKFGNWRCTGPLQFTYVKLGADGSLFDTKARAQLSLTCGGSAASVRDLGRAGRFRVFGCSFGLHPTNASGFHLDAAKKFGLDYVAGRRSYHCPTVVSSCRNP